MLVKRQIMSPSCVFPGASCLHPGGAKGALQGSCQQEAAWCYGRCWVVLRPHRDGQIPWSYQIFEVILVTSPCDMKHVNQSYGIVAFLKCVRSDYYSPLIRFISVRWCLQQFPFPEKYLLSQQRHLKTNIIKNDTAKWAQMDKMEFPFR